MVSVTEVQVKAALQDICTPEMIEGIHITDTALTVSLAVDPARGAAIEPMRIAAEQALRALAPALAVYVVLTAQRDPSRPPPSYGTSSAPVPASTAPSSAGHTAIHGTRAREAGQPARPVLPGVRHVLAVASGKGGVGKSTVAANLACALADAGLSTGLLDADIYGPSQPVMFGVTGKPPTNDDGLIVPHTAHGLKLMSMGFMVDADRPIIWRGLMVQSAIQQLLTDVAWGPLDVLVIDLPPGTGDAQLTLAQKAKVSGAVIVSTPQDIALIDARKGLEMFRKTDVPIFGVIENMSHFHCPNCGHQADIFGHGGARAAAQAADVAFLGEIPLDLDVRISGDAGTPVIRSHPGSAPARAFVDIAAHIIKKLA